MESIEIQIADLIKDVEKISGEAEKVVDSALIKSGNVILSAMKQLVPKRTEFLKNSLEVWKPYANKQGKRTVRVGLDFKKNPKSRYGIYVEFGRKGGKNKKGKKIGAMTPQPFIRPAMEMKRDEAMKIAQQAFEEAIENSLQET